MLQYLYCILRTSGHNFDFNYNVEGHISKCLFDTTNTVCSSAICSHQMMLSNFGSGIILCVLFARNITMAFRVTKCERSTHSSYITLQQNLVFVQPYTVDLLPQGPGYFIGYAYPPAPEEYNTHGPEDPRALRLQGKPYLVFHNAIPKRRQATHVIIRPVLWDVEEERPIILKLKRNLMTRTALHFMEKNWMPVILNETL